jgi:hypothetical protein
VPQTSGAKPAQTQAKTTNATERQKRYFIAGTRPNPRDSPATFRRPARIARLAPGLKSVTLAGISDLDLVHRNLLPALDTNEFATRAVIHGFARHLESTGHRPTGRISSNNRTPKRRRNKTACRSQATYPAGDRVSHLDSIIRGFVRGLPLRSLSIFIRNYSRQIKWWLVSVGGDSSPKNILATRLPGDISCKRPYWGKPSSISRSHFRGVVERQVLRLLNARPYRCHDCDKRFYGFARHTA